MDLITVGKEWGLPWMFAVGALIACWRLVQHLVKETVPKSWYEKERDGQMDDVTEAVKANTSSIEMLSLKVDERLPRRG